MVNFRILNDDDISKIQNAALNILEQTGLRVEHKQARKMLEEKGCTVTEKRVRVPQKVTLECIESAPKKIIIYNREGKECMQLEDKNCYFGTSTASPNTLDYKTGIVRETLVSDIELGARLGDALPNIDFVMPFGSAQNVPSICADLFEFRAAVSNTIKPILFYGYTPEGVNAIYKMAATVAGSLDDLQKRPFLINYPEPISPLTIPHKVVQKMLDGADLNMPQVPGSTVQPGVTSPVTIAGAVAQLIAEGLMSLVIIQLRNPGAPCCLSGNLNIFDMKSTLMSIAAPEMSIGIAAQAEVTQAWGLPTWGLAGSTDSKVLDAQAGIESVYSILVQALAGLNLIHDVGYMDMAMVCSPEMLIMGDEIIGMVRKLLAGIRVDEKTLAEDIIDDVGPGGDFLKTRHTLRNFRKELWNPTLFTRDHYSIWKKGGSHPINHRISEKLDKILKEHVIPSLDSDIKKKMDRLLEENKSEIMKKHETN